MKASTRAKRKYNDANYVRIVLDVKPEVKEEIAEAAKEEGMSMAAYIQGAVREKKERKAKEQEG